MVLRTTPKRTRAETRQIIFNQFYFRSNCRGTSSSLASHTIDQHVNTCSLPKLHILEHRARSGCLVSCWCHLFSCWYCIISGSHMFSKFIAFQHKLQTLLDQLRCLVDPVAFVLQLPAVARVLLRQLLEPLVVCRSQKCRRVWVWSGIWRGRNQLFALDPADIQHLHTALTYHTALLHHIALTHTIQHLHIALTYHTSLTNHIALTHTIQHLHTAEYY